MCTNTIAIQILQYQSKEGVVKRFRTIQVSNPTIYLSIKIALTQKYIISRERKSGDFDLDISQSKFHINSFCCSKLLYSPPSSLPHTPSYYSS